MASPEGISKNLRRSPNPESLRDFGSSGFLQKGQDGINFAILNQQYDLFGGN
jgi:hypothetical protein